MIPNISILTYYIENIIAMYIEDVKLKSQFSYIFNSNHIHTKIEVYLNKKTMNKL
jgi:hypothetical protein